jgi:hypothetical protein
MWPFKKKVSVKRFCCLCGNELKDDERLRAWNRMIMKNDIWFCKNHKTKEILKKCSKEDCPDIYNGYGELFTVANKKQ